MSIPHTARRSLVCMALALALLFSFSACLTSCTPEPPTDPNAELISLLKEMSLYGLDDTRLEGLLAEAIVAATGDPYARYMTRAEYEDYYGGLSGSFVGIGVTVNPYADTALGHAIQILRVHEGSPAQTAGILPGDLITHVNGIGVSQVGYSTALTSLKGEAGSALSLTVYRPSTEETLSLSATRQACTQQTVFYTTFGQVGYLLITAFESVTTSQFIEAVSTLEGQGVTSLVFDLRYNGGGYLRTACEMLAYLLPDGEIASVDYHSDTLTDYTISSHENTLQMGANAHTTDMLGNPLDVSHEATLPMVCLTNSSTASAAELFCASLRDTARENPDTFPGVALVGTLSYGKGCVQTSFALSNGDFVKLTVGLYYPPCGENFDGIGLSPDVAVDSAITKSQQHLSLSPQSDPTLAAALSLLSLS